MERNLAVIVLAAGKGTRMKSDRAKVLHECLGRPLIHWVLDQVRSVGADRAVVVVGHQREEVMARLSDRQVEFAVQDRQLGTGHAVQVCEGHFDGYEGEILVLSGDVPLLSVGTLQRLLETHRHGGFQATVLTAVFEDPSGYGRVIRAGNGTLQRIVEDCDTNSEELAVREINSGIYVFECQRLFQYIHRLEDQNAQGELYLTDVVRFLAEDSLAVGACATDDPSEIAGVNTVEQLAEMERELSLRRKGREDMG